MTETAILKLGLTLNRSITDADEPTITKAENAVKSELGALYDNRAQSDIDSMNAYYAAYLITNSNEHYTMYLNLLNKPVNTRLTMDEYRGYCKIKHKRCGYG